MEGMSLPDRDSLKLELSSLWAKDRYYIRISFSHSLGLLRISLHTLVCLGATATQALDHEEPSPQLLTTCWPV